MNQPSTNHGAATESTKIEQARAVAEVQGAIVAAKSHPRDPVKAQGLMMAACAHRALADSAFYSFPRGGETITGPSISLARELARCWGNISYNIVELNRSDAGGFSEMMAIATDLETNVTSRMQFIQPHKRDTRSGGKALIELRDIYENNTNNGARRLRECIYNVLPFGFIADGEAACKDTIARGDGRPFSEQVSTVVKTFSTVGVTVDQLAKKFDGRTPDKFIPEDVARLRVIWKSMSKGETTLAEEFPPPPMVTVPGDKFVTASLGQKAQEDIAATTGAPLTGNERGVGGQPDLLAQPEQKKEPSAQPAGSDFPGDKPSTARLTELKATLQRAHDEGLPELRATFYNLPLETYTAEEQAGLQDHFATLLKTAKVPANG